MYRKCRVMYQKRQWSSNCYHQSHRVLAISCPATLVTQGDTDDESDQLFIFNNFGRKENRYTSQNIQNEMFAIMANHVIRDLV